MAFNKDLKKCENIEDCQEVLNQEVERLATLTLYQNDPERLEDRVGQLVADVQTHMEANGIDGLITVPRLDNTDTFDIKGLLKSKEFYKKVAYWLSPFVVALGLLITVASVFQVSKVSGHSMDPTMQNGSYLISNKYSDLKRFDIVVATELDKNGKPYAVVKRIIGLPGDTIEYRNDVLYVNDQKTDEPYLAEYLKAFRDDQLLDEYAYDEKIQELARVSPAFTTQRRDLATSEDNKEIENFKVEIPTTGYFLVGDNRLVSKDSRDVGSFPSENIVGKVVWILNRNKK